MGFVCYRFSVGLFRVKALQVYFSVSVLEGKDAENVGVRVNVYVRCVTLYRYPLQL